MRFQSEVSPQQGFTLIEMLITIVIVSILLGVAVTGMQSVIERSQSESTISSVRSDLVFSRGEAIKRGGWVGFCGTNNGTSCSTSLKEGWIVFHDVDKDRLFNNLDTILARTKQDYSSLQIEFTELDASASGPLFFNYRGYPDRSIKIRTHKGDAENSFVLQTTGGIK